tara:strand:- start:3 stop:209 length:207 start_codon:yes stop_codon:yes gene_type:complete
VNKELIVAAVFWFLLILIVTLSLIGCTTSKPEFKPLPPKKLQDLLYKENANIAYKSITKKDYEVKDEC